MLPCLKPEAVAAGMSEPEAADIDVNALHQGYLRGLRQRGGQVLTHAEVTAVRREGTVWQVTMAEVLEILDSHFIQRTCASTGSIGVGVPPVRKKTSENLSPVQPLTQCGALPSILPSLFFTSTASTLPPGFTALPIRRDK